MVNATLIDWRSCTRNWWTMATKKSTSVKAHDISPTIGSMALAHGDAAWGARFVKPGFAFTPEDDLAFALGYPHLTYIADGHPDDVDPEASAPIYVSKHGLRPDVWPREVASRVARAFGYWSVPERVRTAFLTAGPLTEDDARTILQNKLHTSNGQILLFLLEALVGPTLVATTAVNQLEIFSHDEWTDSGPKIRTHLPMTLLALGYVLLRVPARRGEELAARLEVLHREWSAKPLRHRTPSVAALDVVLHGTEGAERSGYRVDGEISTYSTLHVLDDPTWILNAVRACGAPDQTSSPDPRLVFLGGDKVLDLEIARWKKYTKSGSHTIFVEQFGKIKSPRLLPWMLEMSAASTAKTAAQAWFVNHADFAGRFLEKTVVTGGLPAEWARQLLTKLD